MECVTVSLKHLQPSWKKYIENASEEGQLRLLLLFSEEVKSFLAEIEIIEMEICKESSRGVIQEEEEIICMNRYTNEYWGINRDADKCKSFYPIESLFRGRSNVQTVCNVLFDFVDNALKGGD